MAGDIRVNGEAVTRPAQLVQDTASIEVLQRPAYVSRGGDKLAHALETFGIDPAGLICLDVGASTGGFTQVLLARDAARVYAVDVGRGQLHASLRDDPRVISLERTDARVLIRGQLPEPPTLVVCDVSFIGAAKALATPLSLAAERADVVALIKPQFEAGPGRGGVLAEGDARLAAAQAIRGLDGVAGFDVVAVTESPIRGGDGNLEFLVHMRR